MTDMSRLYGTEGAEDLYLDPASAWETSDHDLEEGGPLTIYEWTVHPPEYHLPPTRWLIDYINDYVGYEGEVSQDASEDFGHVLKNSAIIARAQDLIDSIAERVTYRMADSMVGTHQVTLAADGQTVLYDGEPMYRPASYLDEDSRVTNPPFNPTDTSTPKGRLFRISHDRVVAPYSYHPNGWKCVVVKGSGLYPQGGHDIVVPEEEFTEESEWMAVEPGGRG